MNKIYVPILKLRSSEMKALEFLSPTIKSYIIPVIQILSDNKTDRKGDYITAKIKELRKAFAGSHMPFYADFHYVDNYEFSFIEHFLKLVDSSKIDFIPVLSYTKSFPDYRNIIREKYLKNGICLKFDQLRIKNYSIEEFLIYFEETLSKCKEYFQISKTQVDLYFSLEEISERESKTLSNKIIEIILKISNVKAFRRIFISVGSFPKDLNDILVDTERTLYRHEWEFWKKLRFIQGEINLIYSDYGNIHPIYDPNQQGHTGSCSIKYTLEEDYFILRGLKPDKHPDASGQYITKSKNLIKSGRYDGPDFSWGDYKIYEVSERLESTGNAAKWVQYTLNHHISKLVNLLNG